jgi:acyl transferase domain-containing protein
MAICGGVNSILTPINYIALNKARMISKTERAILFPQMLMVTLVERVVEWLY